MSNGLLSRKGMIAILASCMFTVTACSDRKKVKDLEGDNGRLKQQITQLENEKKTTEQKLAETEAQVAELQTRVNEYENAEGTIADLVKEINEKKEIVADLKNIMERLEAEKIEAEGMIREAKIDRDKARSEFNQMTAKNIEAEQRLEKIAQQEKNIEGIIEQLAERETAIARSAKQWRDLYAEHKLDAIFDRLNDEGKIKDKLTFQFSVVALNVSAMDIQSMRAEINKLVKSNENIYRKDMKLEPSVATVTGKINRKNNANAKDAGAIEWIANLGSDSFVMNDSYMVLSSAESVMSLRDKLKAWNKEDKAVFVVPRLIEKLSVSLDMKVVADTKKQLQESAKLRTVFNGKLTEPREVDVDLSKEIDVSAPMQAIAENADCQNLNAACIEGLADKAMLNKRISKDGPVLRTYLRDLFEASSDQVTADLAQLSSGSIKVQGSSGWFAKSDSELCLDPVKTTPQNPVYKDCTPEEVKKAERNPVLQTIELKFSVNMIQKLPRTGYVPVDLAVNDNFAKLAGDLSKAQLHIALPIKNKRSVQFDATEAALAQSVQTFGEQNDPIQGLFKRMEAQGEIYRDFFRGLK